MFSDGKYEERMARDGAQKEGYEDGIFKQYFITFAGNIEGMERPIGLLFHGGKYQAAVFQQARYAYGIKSSVWDCLFFFFP